ncbi:MAG: glycosyltransferase [Rubrivivax sp.]
MDVLSLRGRYPFPDAAARAEADAAVAALPDASVVIADGLAFGALPAVAERHAGRLRWVALVHHPLCLETGLDSDEAAMLEASERRAVATARRVVVTSQATAALLPGRLAVPAAHIEVIEPGCEVPMPAAAGAAAAPAPSLSKRHPWLRQAQPERLLMRSMANPYQAARRCACCAWLRSSRARGTSC